MKAIGYVRVSTEEQVKEGISLENQTERIKALCKAKDWNLVEIIPDRGFSAKDLNRPGVKKLIGLAEKGKVDMVVIYRLDRLTRCVRDLGFLVQDVFDRHNIAFSSICESFDTSNATGRLMLNLIGSIAQWERETIAERTRDSLRYKKSKMEVYGPVPYGFIDVDGNLEQVPEEMAVVDRILTDRQSKKRSYWAISRNLNAEGIKTRAGKPWFPSSIRSIAINEIYVPFVGNSASVVQ